MPKVITNSELSDFMQCHLKWKFSYRDKLTPIQKNVKLRTGGAQHLVIEQTLNTGTFDEVAFLKEFWRDFDIAVVKTQEQKDEEAIQLAYAKKVSAEIKEIYKDAKILWTEKQMSAIIPGTDLKFKTKMDAGVLINGKKWYVEHKTTSAYNSAYLYNLQINAQPTGYLWMLNRKEKIDPFVGILYNLMVKPNANLKDKIAWIDKNKLVRVEYIMRSEQDIKQWLKMMRAFYADFKKPRIYRNPDTQNCSWKCSFNSLCVEDTPEARRAYRIKKSKYEHYQKRG